MNVRTTKRMSEVMLVASAVALAPAALGQLNSSTATITLNATMGETLTISASPTTASFTLVPGGAATASAPVAITTTWVLASGRSTVELDAYFASATAALTDGTNNIPSAHVLGLVSTGSPTSYTAFTQSAALGTASAGLQLFTQTLTSGTMSSTRTDNLSLKIDLTSQPTLPSSTYTGSLILQAQAL
jgi:hypothetical protein